MLGADKPSATIEIKQYQVAFIGSGALGGGSLRFRGEEHDFTIGGLGIGGIGVSSIDAAGEVYHLEKIEDFAGAYAQARWISATSGFSQRPITVCPLQVFEVHTASRLDRDALI